MFAGVSAGVVSARARREIRDAFHRQRSPPARLVARLLCAHLFFARISSRLFSARLFSERREALPPLQPIARAVPRRSMQRAG